MESNPKPLQTFIKKTIHHVSKRLQLRLQNYDVRVRHKNSTTLHLADTLSRAYLCDATVQMLPAKLKKERVFAAEHQQLKHNAEEK